MFNLALLLQRKSFSPPRSADLGNPNLPDAAKCGTAAVKPNARRFAANVRPIIDEIIAAGATSHNAIAA